MNLQGMMSEIGNVELRQMTTRLMRGENLARGEAANFLNALLNPAATDAQVAAALAVLAAKGETIEELAGTVVNRIIDLAGLEMNSFRWGGE